MEAQTIESIYANDFSPTYFNEDIIRREAVRYLFFPGDVIDVRRKQELTIFAHGGEEIASACLVRTKGFLRRCRITPLERWGEVMPLELMPEGVTPIGITQVASQGSEQGYTSFKGNLHGYPKYPGEEVTWILHTADNSGMRKGIVELTSLRALEWKDFVATGIQELFFPGYPNLPASLREVEEMIDAVRSSDSKITQIRSEMLAACAQFRQWATARVEIENVLLKIGTTKEGWTYTYSGLAEALLPQLEMERADHYLQNQARFQGDLAETQQRLVDAIEKIGQGSPGLNVTELVSVIQLQMAEQQKAMMEQNQKFLSDTLARLFGDPSQPLQPEQSSPPSQPQANNKNKKG